MEGTGYWIVLALLYLFSMWAKKQQQARARQQAEDGNGKEASAPAEPPRPEFLKKMFKEAGFDFVFDEEEEIEEPVYEVQPEPDPEPEETTIREKMEEFDRRLAEEQPAEMVFPKKHWDIEGIYSEMDEENEDDLLPELEDIEDLREAIILKEVLDRPRALRRAIR